MAAFEHAYTYLHPSALDETGGSGRLLTVVSLE